MPLKFSSEISRFFSKVDGLEESWCRINLAQGGCSAPALHLWLSPAQRHLLIAPERMSLHVNIKYNP